MLSVLFMILDLLLAFFIVLTIFRFIRVVFMRLKFIHNIKTICKNEKYLLELHRFPLTSVFYKSGKIDLTVKTPNDTYYIKLIASYSSKKRYHFVDSNRYVTYLKTFFVLPMATQVSENVSFVSYHEFPQINKKDSLYDNEKYVMLFNPMPNEISYIEKDGSKQIAGNGSRIGEFYVYNGKGFCSCITGVK